jgi:hypothetical protein
VRKVLACGDSRPSGYTLVLDFLCLHYRKSKEVSGSLAGSRLLSSGRKFKGFWAGRNHYPQV